MAARVYLIGEDGPDIAKIVERAAPTEISGTLDVAVGRAREMATDGQWVLLAPACASFDQFADYGERGDRFSALAQNTSRLYALKSKPFPLLAGSFPQLLGGFCQ